MRYAKYPGGQKYDDDGAEREPQRWADGEKREAALVYRDAWERIREDPDYQRMKRRHIKDVFDPDVSPMD
jgi:hypothetical protein